MSTERLGLLVVVIGAVLLGVDFLVGRDSPLRRYLLLGAIGCAVFGLATYGAGGEL